MQYLLWAYLEALCLLQLTQTTRPTLQGSDAKAVITIGSLIGRGQAVYANYFPVRLKGKVLQVYDVDIQDAPRDDAPPRGPAPPDARPIPRETLVYVHRFVLAG